MQTHRRRRVSPIRDGRVIFDPAAARQLVATRRRAQASVIIIGRMPFIDREILCLTVSIKPIAMRIVAAALIFASASANIITDSDARLPMSLSSVISDLEAEGCEELTTAAVICSRSVTKTRQAGFWRTVTGDESADGRSKAVGTTSGLALAQPSSDEVALTAAACAGVIVYYPDAVDLQRSEGLFDTLGPAMEKLLLSKKGSLIVVVDDASQIPACQARLEAAAESVVSSLISDRPVSSLEDVFDRIEYVTASDAADAVNRLGQATPPMEAASRVAETVDLETMLSWPSPPPSLSAGDLAAARKLGPAARSILASTVATVKSACLDDSGEVVLVPAFGDLCSAAMDQALVQLEEEASEAPGVMQSNLGQQIRSNLVSELDAALGDFFEGQLDLLLKAEFEACRAQMSKLLVSPNLGSDMMQLATKSAASFAKSAGRLVAKKSSWAASPAKHRYEVDLKDFVTTRLEAAQASGQFRPLPRKGVTVGFHWLLPKPFGNDYRQEPWMVHASDNLVYIPPDKISDVAEDEVAAGDWRQTIVPSPAGNDMLYMQ